MGHNGAGKTTTLRLLNGVLAPTGGKVWVLGLNPVEDGPTLRRRTGVLTETLHARGDIFEVSSNRNVLTAPGLARERIPDAIAALVQAGIRVYRVASQEPSLEDVYFSLHERNKREASR